MDPYTRKQTRAKIVTSKKLTINATNKSSAIDTNGPLTPGPQTGDVNVDSSVVDWSTALERQISERMMAETLAGGLEFPILEGNSAVLLNNIGTVSGDIEVLVRPEESENEDEVVEEEVSQEFEIDVECEEEKEFGTDDTYVEIDLETDDAYVEIDLDSDDEVIEVKDEVELEDTVDKDESTEVYEDVSDEETWEVEVDNEPLVVDESDELTSEIDVEVKEELDHPRATSTPNPEPYIPQPVITPTPSDYGAYFAREVEDPQPSTSQQWPSKIAPLTHYHPYRRIEETPKYQRAHREQWRQQQQHQQQQEVPTEKIYWRVREVIPIVPEDFCAVPMPAQNQGEAGKRQTYNIYPTEWIAFGSPYWLELIERMKYEKFGEWVKITSMYDGNTMRIIKYPNGRMVATRNHPNVVLRMRGKATPPPVVTEYLSKDWNKVSGGMIPTEFIPIESPYYSELVGEMFFPTEGNQWVHTKGRDGKEVHLCLGPKGEYVNAYRNEVTVRLFTKD